MIAILDEESGFMNINGEMCRLVDPNEEKIEEDKLIRIHFGDTTLTFTPLPTLYELWDCWKETRDQLDMKYEQSTEEVIKRINNLQILARGD